MEYLTVYLIIQSNRDNQNLKTSPVLREGIRTTVTVDPNILIKDICHVALYKIGLGHLSFKSEGFVKYPKSNLFISTDSFSNPILSIGSLEAIHREYITIKICVNENIENFSDFEGRNFLHRNLLQLLLKKYPFIKTEEKNPVIREAIDKINDSSLLSLEHPYLYYINDNIVKELQTIQYNKQQSFVPVNQSFNLNNFKNSTSPPYVTSSVIYNSPVEMLPPNRRQSFTRENEIYSNTIKHEIQYNTTFNGGRSSESTLSNFSTNTPTIYTRIKFDKNIEVPILEKWYKIIKKPSQIELRIITDEINKVSLRHHEEKITIKSIRHWFGNRRNRDKRLENN